MRPAGACTPASPGTITTSPASDDSPGLHPAPPLQCRSAATGEEAVSLGEARLRVEAAATNLAYAAVGQADAQEVLDGSIRLLEQALAGIDRARGDDRNTQ